MTSTISTYLGYRLYANDYEKSLQRTAKEPSIAKDQAYYQANIGKVTTVDGFLKDYRLFSYAMKAYGLDDLGNAQGLMKKVLESDLTDPNSFARRVSDKRYLAFAQAYSFLSNGTVASTSQLQTTSQRADLLAKVGGSQSAQALLGVQLDSIKSIADLESNSSLYNSVLTAYGLSAQTTSPSDVTSALESNLSDPGSFLYASGKEGLLAMARHFNFSSKGAIGVPRELQSAASIKATETAYLAAVGTSAVDKAAANVETTYYEKKIGTLTSVDQLLSDGRLVAYVEKAFGINTEADKSPITTKQLGAILTSNLLDPNSLANTYGATPSSTSGSSSTATSSPAPTTYQLLASAFGIGTDGTAWDHSTVMPPANVSAAIAAYTATAKSEGVAQDTQDADTARFAAAVLSATSVDSLLADPKVVNYIQMAFHLETMKTADLRDILTSNLLDPTSVASKLGGNAVKLATAFNFAPSGLVYAQRPIQSAKDATATTSAYMAQAKPDAGSQSAAQAETDYFNTRMTKVKSLDDILSDKRLLAYFEAAYAIPKTTPTSRLRQALTSDLNSAKGLANTLGGGFVSMAASLNIASDGSIAPVAQGQAQTKAGIIATTRAYLEQQMESEANDQNPGIQLALYFRTKAPTITSAFDILSDKALTKVVQTMLGLPADSSKADIDSQARTITSRLKLSDLKDPAKLDKLIARFSSLYDLQNSSSSSSDMISALFGSGSSSSS